MSNFHLFYTCSQNRAQLRQLCADAKHTRTKSMKRPSAQLSKLKNATITILWWRQHSRNLITMFCFQQTITCLPTDHLGLPSDSRYSSRGVDRLAGNIHNPFNVFVFAVSHLDTRGSFPINHPTKVSWTCWSSAEILLRIHTETLLGGGGRI